jgi:hypothetical protein
MRALSKSCCLVAVIAACPIIANAQEMSTTTTTSDGLRQTTIIEDPFLEPRVPVSPPAFHAPRSASSQSVNSQDQQALRSLTASSTTQSSTTQSQSSEFDRGADLDPLQDSALAFSGRDSIAQDAEERNRQSMLAGTGNLSPVEDTVRARARIAQTEPYAPNGIRRGNFILSPEVEIGSAFSSNLRSESRDGPDDIGLRIAPRLAFRSDWSRHALAFDFKGEHIFYDKFKEQNANNFSLAVSGRVDIRSTTTLDLTAGFGQSQSSSADFEVPDTARGLRDDQAYTVTSRLTHQMNRVIAQVTAAATWFKFGNVDLGPGLEELNDDRNYVAPAVGLRVGYQMSGAVQPFVEVTYSPRLHDLSVDRNGLRRDSQGVIFRSGVTFNDVSIWSGEVAARYEIRDYEDATLKTQQALGMDANVTWNISELTSIGFTASSQIEETSDPLVAGAKTWNAGVQLAHQFRDNLAGEAGIGVGYTDYDGVSDKTVISASLGVAYAIRPQIELISGYVFISQDPGEAGGYEEHRISSGVRFRL